MSTYTVKTTSFVSLPDDIVSPDPEKLAEQIVKQALDTAEEVYLVGVERNAVLLER